MTYSIKYDEAALKSSDGYRWEPVNRADLAAKGAAMIVNSAIEMASHHEPVQVILESLGESVVINSIPVDSSDDCIPA